MTNPRIPAAALATTLQSIYQTLPNPTTPSTAAAHALDTNGTNSPQLDPWERALLHNAKHVSTPLALRLLKQMGLDHSHDKPVKLFENTCGIGVVAPALQQVLRPGVLGTSKVLCGDFSEKAVGFARRRAETEGWGRGGMEVKVERVDAQKTGLPDGEFTHVATNIGFHVVPDSEAALNEAIRVLQPGGILGFTTWHREAAWFGIVKEAFKSFPFEAPCEMALQTTAWGEWSDVNWTRKILMKKGLKDVKVDVFAHLSHVESATDFITHYAMMIDWIMGSCWSEELRKEHPREEVQRLVREFLEKKHGGGWEESWVALIASARVPS